jgi:hypothetical protein
VGFVTFLLAAAVGVVLLFVAGALASAAKLKSGSAMIALTFGIAGAWLGAMLGADFAGGAWQPIWAGTGGIALSAAGGAVGLLAGVVLHVAMQRRMSPSEPPAPA